MTRRKTWQAAVTALLVMLGGVTTHAVDTSAVPDDPVLQAMRMEMERSKSELKLDQVAAPYYIEYHVTDLEASVAEAAFGAIRSNVHTRLRYLRVVVRIGDYKQDSYYGSGEGVLDALPVDDDVQALRLHLWIATDRAYKQAAEALTQKQARLKEFNVEQPVDDFAQAKPVQAVGSLATTGGTIEPWLDKIRKACALYKSDALIESLDSTVKFQTVNRYFLNSEGTMVRSGQNAYELVVAGSTQAPDGMRLNRSWDWTVPDAKELPSEQEFLTSSARIVQTLKELRAAPVVDEEYRGPVLFSADAASSVVADLVGENVLGLKPDIGSSARTKGAWASNYKTHVLPDFLSVVDDPTLASIQGKSLMGHYGVDDEGVKAESVSLVERGTLTNYVVGRAPIRGFPASNGHGRAKIGSSPGPSLGNLIVKSSQPLSGEELKKKLIELCRGRELPYGYFVETVGPQLTPRLLYRVWTNDGHQELVRGGTFAELDTRALRNDLVAAGNDLNVENRVLNIPHSIVSPSILFEELEVKRTNANKEKLPDYPPPPLSGSK